MADRWQLGLVLALVAFTAGAVDDCTLTVGWEPYGAYMYIEEDGEPAGADIELVQALAREIGCKTHFELRPWARQLLELETGRLDMATSVSRTPEREAYCWFSDPYRGNDMALYVRRGESARYRLESLAAIPVTGFRLGIVDQYNYGAEFTALMQDPAFARQVETSVDYATTIRKLIGGRTDGFLAEDVGVVIHEAKALGLYEQMEVYPLALRGGELHLVFSRRSVDPATVEAANAALARMRADGRLQRILDKYLRGMAPFP